MNPKLQHTARVQIQVRKHDDLRNQVFLNTRNPA